MRHLIELSSECRELGLTFIINRGADKQYEFCKGTKVIWAVRTTAEARKFFDACKINRQTLDAILAAA